MKIAILVHDDGDTEIRNAEGMDPYDLDACVVKDGIEATTLELQDYGHDPESIEAALTELVHDGGWVEV